ncbi:flavin-nucleotide-binding protein [Haloprofundus marisrubri]|uniref:Flavin-nucleotide-binding protein n=1 Tax=Haloprofundus marisrubri TaxID=1514971 RepID=A0A0W1REV7_9EURY|nr:pyridoxamine 5'-phosphate oxidase family protein [Haloprofundus marisrubri]KTG11619.1 flavin-nucleotide-binding protein [Haloprofundus marisrubri]
MQGIRWVQLSTDELNAFLGSGGTGVISFGEGVDKSPFTVPVSYGYDAETGNFYFRLSFRPEGTKESVVDRPITFVTHAQTDDRWRSVVATGTLEDVTEASYESNAVQGLWAVEIPEVDIFDRPPEEITFREYRLDPEMLTGRKEVKAGD